MLKRQRPSSPISFPDEDMGAAADLYEPNTKRRRYFAPPPSFTSPSQPQQKQKRDHPDTDSDDDECGHHRRERDFNDTRARVREWHMAAGVYKDANSLLHDLHAEQRHRALFTAPPSFPHAHEPSSSSYPHLGTASASQSTPDHHASALTDPHSGLFSPPQPPQRAYEDELPGDGRQLGQDGEGQNEQVEAEVVNQNYENSNRLLRALFLSRRRAINGQDQT